MAERERREKILEEREFWKVYIAVYREAIADAAANGQPPPTPLPHPDDIVVDYEKGVRFIGPIDEEDAAHIDELLRLCDVYIMQHALDERTYRKANRKNPLDQAGTAMVFAHCLNRYLPERCRLSDNEIADRVMQYADMPNRALLKKLHRAWQAVGAPTPRGSTFPPLRIVKQMIEMIQEVKRA